MAVMGIINAIGKPGFQLPAMVVLRVRSPEQTFPSLSVYRIVLL